jgi:hypothetical protein
MRETRSYFWPLVTHDDVGRRGCNLSIFSGLHTLRHRRCSRDLAPARSGRPGPGHPSRLAQRRQSMSPKPTETGRGGRIRIAVRRSGDYRTVATLLSACRDRVPAPAPQEASSPALSTAPGPQRRAGPEKTSMKLGCGSRPDSPSIGTVRGSPLTAKGSPLTALVARRTNPALERTQVKIADGIRGGGVSSISSGRIVSSMFMRVHARCAHQLRPPSTRQQHPRLLACRSAGAGRFG